GDVRVPGVAEALGEDHDVEARAGAAGKPDDVAGHERELVSRLGVRDARGAVPRDADYRGAFPSGGVVAGPGGDADVTRGGFDPDLPQLGAHQLDQMDRGVRERVAVRPARAL